MIENFLRKKKIKNNWIIMSDLTEKELNAKPESKFAVLKETDQ